MRKLFFLFVVWCSAAAALPVVVFDFGGVMADFNRDEMTLRAAKALQITPEQFVSIIDEHRNVLATGSTSEAEFWAMVAEKYDLELPENWRSLVTEWMQELVAARPEMYAYVEKLRQAGYRVALFSNVSEWQSLALGVAGLYDPFSPRLYSWEIGARKPQRDAYEILLSRLGVEAEQCIFFDDRAENVAAALDCGIHAFHVTAFEDLPELADARIAGS